MEERPYLSPKLDADVFCNYYFLKEELIAFCRREGLQTSGGKVELTERITHYLATGEKLDTSQRQPKAKDVGILTPSSLIESPFVCSEKHRAFFKETIGAGFSFHVAFQTWLKKNTGKSYQEAIEAYFALLEEKKKSTTNIDKQFEYNTYIRAFFADNGGKSLKDAIACWKYKKAIQGHNRYEKTDLTALEQD